MAESKVWVKFSSTKRDDGTVLNFRIQKLPSDRIEVAINFLKKYFFTSENIQRAAGIHKNPDAVEEFGVLMSELMKQPNCSVAVCYFDDGLDTIDSDIIGISTMSMVKGKDDKELEQLEALLKTKEVRKFIEIIYSMAENDDNDKSQGHYEGRGVIVHPDYRGLGIATQFLKVRRMVCLEEGVPQTSAWMSSLGTQKAAERDGWKTVYEIPFDELGQRFGVTFENTPPLYKLMLAHVSMPVPKVWLRFSSTKLDGTVLNFRFQDLPSDRFEDLIAFNMEHFLPSENLQKATGAFRYPESNEECRQLLSGFLKKPVMSTVICCLDNSNPKGDILGVSTVSLVKQDDNDDLKDIDSQVQTKQVRKLLEIIMGLAKMHNIKEKYISHGYHEGRGVVVHPAYRGLGIATQFLKVRRMQAIDQGVPMTMAWMTSLGTQKAADKEGWKTVYEVPFEELGRQFEVTFEDAPPICKLMLAEV